MSIKVMTYVWEHSKHKGSELLTLLAIADHCDDGGVGYPSIPSLARKTRMTDRNTQLILKKLQHSQELAIHPSAGPHGCHLFVIAMAEKLLEGEKFSPKKQSKKSAKQVIATSVSTDEEFSGEKFSGVQTFRGEKSGNEGVKNPVKNAAPLSLPPSDSPPLTPPVPEPSGESSELQQPLVDMVSSEQPRRLTPDRLIDLYNQLIPSGHPRVQTRSDGRIKKARQYLRQFPDELYWIQVFMEIGRSQLLRGEKPSNDHEHFIADFDWLLQKGKNGTENFVKVAEGKYRDKSKQYGNHSLAAWAAQDDTPTGKASV